MISLEQRNQSVVTESFASSERYNGMLLSAAETLHEVVSAVSVRVQLPGKTERVHDAGPVASGGFGMNRFPPLSSSGTVPKWYRIACVAGRASFFPPTRKASSSFSNVARTMCSRYFARSGTRRNT